MVDFISMCFILSFQTSFVCKYFPAAWYWCLLLRRSVDFIWIFL